MALDYGVDVWRTAMEVIQECGKDKNPKEYAFAKSSKAHAKGDTEEAARWAKIANAITLALEDVENPEHVPTAVH